MVGRDVDVLDRHPAADVHDLAALVGQPTPAQRNALVELLNDYRYERHRDLALGRGVGGDRDASRGNVVVLHTWEGGGGGGGGREGGEGGRGGGGGGREGGEGGGRREERGRRPVPALADPTTEG